MAGKCGKWRNFPPLQRRAHQCSQVVTTKVGRLGASVSTRTPARPFQARHPHTNQHGEPYHNNSRQPAPRVRSPLSNPSTSSNKPRTAAKPAAHAVQRVPYRAQRTRRTRGAPRNIKTLTTAPNRAQRAVVPSIQHGPAPTNAAAAAHYTARRDTSRADRRGATVGATCRAPIGRGARERPGMTGPGRDDVAGGCVRGTGGFGGAASARGAARRARRRGRGAVACWRGGGGREGWRGVDMLTEG